MTHGVVTLILTNNSILKYHIIQGELKRSMLGTSLLVRIGIEGVHSTSGVEDVAYLF